MPWDRAVQALGTGSLGPEIPCSVSTVRPHGRPHSAGIDVAEHDRDLCFTSGPETRKSRKLTETPACTLSLRLDGLDLIFEGEAERVVDPATLEAVAAVFRDGGWPATVAGDAITVPYSAQTAEPAVAPLARQRRDRVRRRAARASRNEPLTILNAALDDRAAPTRSRRTSPACASWKDWNHHKSATPPATATGSTTWLTTSAIPGRASYSSWSESPV